MKESHMKSVQAAKGKGRFLCSSQVHLDDASSKVSGDTNFEQDICIPAIHVNFFDPLLEPVNTNKQTNKHKLYYVIWLRR